MTDHGFTGWETGIPVRAMQFVAMRRKQEQHEAAVRKQEEQDAARRHVGFKDAPLDFRYQRWKLGMWAVALLPFGVFLFLVLAGAAAEKACGLREVSPVTTEVRR